MSGSLFLSVARFFCFHCKEFLVLYEVITGIHVNQIKSFTSFNKVSSRFKRSVSCRSLDRVMAKYKATFPIGAKSKASKSRKKKEQKKKREKKRIAAVGLEPV